MSFSTGKIAGTPQAVRNSLAAWDKSLTDPNPQRDAAVTLALSELDAAIASEVPGVLLELVGHHYTGARNLTIHLETITLAP